MKKILIGVLSIIIIAGIGFWALNSYIYNEKQSDVEAGSNASVSGKILDVNLEQVAFDGPIVITLETNEGDFANIEVPSMGINLCAAKDNIADPFALKVGNMIEVSGRQNELGAIIPCESENHYLRVSAN